MIKISVQAWMAEVNGCEVLLLFSLSSSFLY
jgi:hypothetical protein